MTSNDTKKWSKFQKSWGKTSIFMGANGGFRKTIQGARTHCGPASWMSQLVLEAHRAPGIKVGRHWHVLWEKIIKKNHDFMDIWWPQFLDEMNIQWIWMDLFMDVGWKLEFCIRWTWNPQELVPLEFLCQATKFKGSHGYPSWGRAQLFRRIFTAIHPVSQVSCNLEWWDLRPCWSQNFHEFPLSGAEELGLGHRNTPWSRSRHSDGALLMAQKHPTRTLDKNTEAENYAPCRCEKSITGCVDWYDFLAAEHWLEQMHVSKKLGNCWLSHWV